MDSYTFEDTPKVPYCSTVKQFFGILIGSECNISSYEELLGLHTAIYTNQPMLTLQFWSCDALQDQSDVPGVDEPTQKKLLEYAILNFPSQFSPLLKIFTALSADEYSGTMSYRGFGQLVSYQQALDMGPENMDAVTATNGTCKVTSPSGIICGPIQLPRGTSGIIASEAERLGESTIIRWSIEYSGWHYCLVVLDEFVDCIRGLRVPHPTLQEDVKSILLFIHQLAAVSPKFLPILEDHLRNRRYSPVVLPQVHIDLLESIFQIFATCAFWPTPPYELLDACTKCIYQYTLRDPTKSWKYFCRFGLLPHDFSGDLLQIKSSKSAIRHILSYECSIGRYDINRTFLQLMSAYLKLVIQRYSSEKGDNFPRNFLPCLSFVRGDVWSTYDSWRYRSARDRWSIASDILRLFHEILWDTPTTSRAAPGSPKESLMSSLLWDSSFHANLLKIVSIGADELEQRLERSYEEGLEICKLVDLAFQVLELVLSSKQYYVKSGTMCCLEENLLDGKFRPNGEALVLIIASYINISHSPLAISATKVLSRLCRVKMDGDYPILVGYLAPKKAALRKAFLSNLGDQRKTDELRIAILDLMTSATETQPGLAAFFLLKGVKDQDDNWQSTLTGTEANLFTEPDDSVIFSIINECKDLYKQRPALLASTLDLLASLWNNAPSQYAFILELKKEKNFWPYLVQLFRENPYGDHDPADASPAAVAQNRAFRVVIRARALQVVYSEIFYVSSSSNLDLLGQELQDFFAEQLADEDGISAWIKTDTQCSFNPRLRKACLEATGELRIDLEALATLPSAQVYGDSYFYNTGLLAKKLDTET